MRKKELLALLNEDQEHDTDMPKGERILLIDGLNLFFRNFAVLQMVNPKGVHIGGLGGFFRSLGALIRQIQPHQVYVVFDGAGSSMNRKNIMPCVSPLAPRWCDSLANNHTPSPEPK